MPGNYVNALFMISLAVGGILIFGVGLKLLEIAKIKTGNLLPSVLVPVIYYSFDISLFNLLQ